MKETGSDHQASLSHKWLEGVARAITVAGIRILSVLTGLAYVKYYTNELTIDQVGNFFYLGTLSYILNALIFVPVDSYMQARLANLNELPARALQRLVATTLAIGLVVCIALSLLLILTGLLEFTDIPLLYVMAALLYLCSSARSLLNIRGQARFAASMTLLESTARLLAFVIAAFIFEATARMLLLSSIAALSIELSILWWKIRQTLTFSATEKTLDSPSHILRTTSKLSGAAISNTTQLQGYRVLFPIVGYAGTSATLGVTTNIGAVAMSACAQVLSQLLLPRLYHTHGASIGQYAGWSIATAISLLAVALPMSDYLVLHLTRAEYIPYAPAIGIGITIEACNMLIGAYTVFLTLHGRAGVLFLFQMAGAVLSLVGCLTLLMQAPDSPILLGLMISGTQLLITLALGLYIYKLKQQRP